MNTFHQKFTILIYCKANFLAFSLVTCGSLVVDDPEKVTTIVPAQNSLFSDPTDEANLPIPYAQIDRTKVECGKTSESFIISCLGLRFTWTVTCNPRHVLIFCASTADCFRADDDNDQGVQYYTRDCLDTCQFGDQSRQIPAMALWQCTRLRCSAYKPPANAAVISPMDW